VCQNSCQHVLVHVARFAASVSVYTDPPQYGRFDGDPEPPSKVPTNCAHANDGVGACLLPPPCTTLRNDKEPRASKQLGASGGGARVEKSALTMELKREAV
jgi:hypothetical protein